MEGDRPFSGPGKQIAALERPLVLRLGPHSVCCGQPEQPAQPLGKIFCPGKNPEALALPKKRRKKGRERAVPGYQLRCIEHSIPYGGEVTRPGKDITGARHVPPCLPAPRETEPERVRARSVQPHDAGCDGCFLCAAHVLLKHSVFLSMGKHPLVLRNIGLTARFH